MGETYCLVPPGTSSSGEMGLEPISPQSHFLSCPCVVCTVHSTKTVIPGPVHCPVPVPGPMQCERAITMGIEQTTKWYESLQIRPQRTYQFSSSCGVS